MMRARLLLWLADSWWGVRRRPAPWTWRERRAAVCAAEMWLHAEQASAARRHARGGVGNP